LEKHMLDCNIKKCIYMALLHEKPEFLKALEIV